jgi:glutathione S-transferase kappa 1
LTSVAARNPDETESVALALSKAYWSNNRDISDEIVLKSVLGECMSEEDVGYHISRAGSSEIKGMLKRRTQEAVDAGAFGAPSMLITNGEGKTEFFFGSDRFEHVALFLEVPWLGYQPDKARSKL